jgi:sorting and assembly machinery component 37
MPYRIFYLIVPIYRHSSTMVTVGRLISDLYLYTTYANYIATTRHAYTTFLPLYANYIVPPARRKAAIARTATYGTEFLQTDIDERTDSTNTINARSGGADSVAGSTASPGFFGFGRQQLSQAQRTMRLNSILARATVALENTEEMLVKKNSKWIMNEHRPSLLDAVVIGYLGLILTTKVPDTWAKDIIMEKVPRLSEWVLSRTKGVFDGIDSSP